MKIELTTEEANVLLTMINIAVMQKGLEAAEAGLHFKRKIEDAAKEPMKRADESNVIDLPAKEA